MQRTEIRGGLEAEGIYMQSAGARNTSNARPSPSANEKCTQPGETSVVLVERFERRLYSMNGFKYELNRYQMNSIVAMLIECLDT